MIPSGGDRWEGLPGDGSEPRSLCPNMLPYSIRLARPKEAALVSEIEELAGVRYADAGLPPDLEGLEPELILEALRQSLLWMVVNGDRALGFVLCRLFPDALHLRELDVHPEFMGRGLGRALVEHVVTVARQRRLRLVTLTTFRDVAWNAPLYRRWGFSEVSFSALPGWLQAIRREEEAGELAQWPRVAMIRRTDTGVARYLDQDDVR